MPLSIIDDTMTAPANQRKGVDLSQLKTGDKLEARIVEMSSSGRTVLQFAGFRAVVDKLAGGREGDVLQFEVLPDNKSASGRDQNRRPSTARSSAWAGMRSPNGGPPDGKTVRLIALPEAGAARAHAKEISILRPKSVSQAPPFALATTTPATPPANAFEIISTWFRRLRKNRQHPWRTGETRPPRPEKAESTRGASQPKTVERSGMLESERVDRPREPHTHADYNVFQLGGWPVKMRIYGHPPGTRPDKAPNFFKAVFLLDLDHVGPVRADIQMGDKQINVGFFVASEDCRASFAKALPELTTALSPLAKHCHCHVVLSPPKIQEFLNEEGRYPGNTLFEIRA